MVVIGSEVVLVSLADSGFLVVGFEVHVVLVLLQLQLSDSDLLVVLGFEVHVVLVSQLQLTDSGSLVVGIGVGLVVAEVQLGDLESPDSLVAESGEEAICGVEVETMVYDGGGVDVHEARGDVWEDREGGVDVREVRVGVREVHVGVQEDRVGVQEVREGGVGGVDRGDYVCYGDLYCILGKTEDHP